MDFIDWKSADAYLHGASPTTELVCEVKNLMKKKSATSLSIRGKR
jgi:hypothetical protein